MNDKLLLRFLSIPQSHEYWKSNFRAEEINLLKEYVTKLKNAILKEYQQESGGENEAI